MTLVKISSRVINLDQITCVLEQVGTDRGTGETVLLSARVQFVDGRHLDFYDEAAGAIVATIASRLSETAMVVPPPSDGTPP